MNYDQEISSVIFMIHLSGDLHGKGFIRFTDSHFPERNSLSKKDFVIVLGDFGLIWSTDPDNTEERFFTNFFNDSPFTILFIDGNHENFDRLYAMEEHIWHGGRVHMISSNIIHLMRGQVFSLAEKTFFVCGGASSIDKEHRTLGTSWWSREDISYAECNEGIDNLEKAGDVDFILTHTCPSDLLFPMFQISPLRDPTAQFLNEIALRNKSAEWYFGHHHIDKDFGRFHCLYQRVVRIV